MNINVKKSLPCALALGLALSLLPLAGCSKKEEAPKAAPGAGAPAARPPVPVVTGKVKKVDFPVELKSIGTVEAIRSMQVKAQVGGYITEVRFKEGDPVRAGQVLFKLDSRPVEGTIKQLTSDLARMEAQIKVAEAQEKAARSQVNTAEAQARASESQLKSLEAQVSAAQTQADFNAAQATRYEGLAQKEYISKEQLDQIRTSKKASESSLAGAKASLETVKSSMEAAKSQAETSRAQAESAKAAIESAKAGAEATRTAIENAKIQLAYTTLTAPFSGQAGTIFAKVGDLVKANDTTSLVVINQISPIYVRFTVPESEYANIQKYRKEGTLSVYAKNSAAPGGKLEGKLVFMDNAVDRTTGTITLKAEFANAGQELWPGQFADVTMTLYTIKDALSVPSAAVMTGQKGTYVFVIDAEGAASVRPVKIGKGDNEKTLIDDGVKLDETVVIDGQIRLVPGSKVVEKSAVGTTPPAQPANTPPKG